MPSGKSVLLQHLVNALVHRDYMVSAPIRLGNSIIRNPILASYAAKGILPYRGLGSGIKRALEEWPEIDFTDDREGCLFTATVYRKVGESSGIGSVKSHNLEKNHRISSGKTIKRPEGSVKSSGKTAERILDLVKRRPKTTIPELASALKVTTRAVEKQIAKLKKSGRLRRIGPAKGGHWEVP